MMLLKNLRDIFDNLLGTLSDLVDDGVVRPRNGDTRICYDRVYKFKVQVYCYGGWHTALYYDKDDIYTRANSIDTLDEAEAIKEMLDIQIQTKTEDR